MRNYPFDSGASFRVPSQWEPRVILRARPSFTGPRRPVSGHLLHPQPISTQGTLSRVQDALFIQSEVLSGVFEKHPSFKQDLRFGFLLLLLKFFQLGIFLSSVHGARMMHGRWKMKN